MHANDTDLPLRRRDRGTDEALRRADGRPRCRPPGPPRLRLRLPRPERRRQDDPHPHAARADTRVRRPNEAARPVRAAAASRRARTRRRNRRGTAFPRSPHRPREPPRRRRSPRPRGSRPHRRGARAGRPHRPSRRPRQDVLPGHAPAPRHCALPARRPRAPHPRRADERARPRGHPGVPRVRPVVRGRRAHDRPLLAPARRNREDLRPRRNRRRRHDRRTGLHRRAPRGRPRRLRRSRRHPPRTRRPRGARGGRTRHRRRRSPRRVGARRPRRPRSQPPPRRGRHRRAPARAPAGLARAASPRDHDPIGERSMTAFALPAPRLVAADVLKLRRNRSLALVTGVLTVGAVAITVAVMELLHLTNATKHGPAGGVQNLGHVAFLIAMLGTAAAAIVGSRAGAGDKDAGVYRDLVVTGRSRVSLYLSRIPAGIAFLLPFVAGAYALEAVSAVVLAGLWTVLEVTFFYLLSVAVAALLGSRSYAIGVVLAFRLAITPIVASISALGIVRELMPGVAMQSLAPAGLGDAARQGPAIAMSTAAVAAVLLVWAVAALALAGWRDVTRDA